MKKKFLFFAVTVLFSACIFAQGGEPGKGFDKSKLFFGGNFGLSFGNYTLVNLSPQVGYHFSDYFAAGTGINFIYSQYKTTDFSTGDTYSRQSQGYVGLNIFGRVYPIPQILFQVQPEINYSWGNIKYYNPDQEYKLDGKFIPSVLAGAGVALPTGRAGALIILAEYDIVQDPRSPYGNTVFFSVGYNVGL